MIKIKKYELLKDLPMYPAGTIVLHKYEILPSKFNNNSYVTEGEWMTEKESCHAPQFLEKLVSWCAETQRDDCQGWVRELK